MIETVNYGEPDYPLKDIKSMRLLDNKVYMIHYDATPSDKFPNYLQQAQAIIDSFQIIIRQLEYQHSI
jgi:DNA-binding GntR family transcriptional regulator